MAAHQSSGAAEEADGGGDWGSLLPESGVVGTWSFWSGWDPSTPGVWRDTQRRSGAANSWGGGLVPAAG